METTADGAVKTSNFPGSNTPRPDGTDSTLKDFSRAKHTLLGSATVTVCTRGIRLSLANYGHSAMGIGLANYGHSALGIYRIFRFSEGKGAAPDRH